MALTRTEEKKLTRIAGQIKELDRQANDLLLEIGRLLVEAQEIHARPGRGSSPNGPASTASPPQATRLSIPASSTRPMAAA